VIWKKPHISKIYEALTAIADKRTELVGDNKGRCYSSSRGKYYEIEFDLNTNSIMSNDNTAYYTDSLSYPMIAVLMLKGEVVYDEKLLALLKGIYWKDVNQKFKNNYDESVEFVLKDLAGKGVNIDFIKKEVNKMFSDIIKKEFKFLGSKTLPPSGY